MSDAEIVRTLIDMLKVSGRKDVERLRFCMGMLDYADLLMDGSRTVDVLTVSSSDGQVATVFGVPVFADAAWSARAAVLLDEDGTELAHADGAGRAHPADCGDPACVVRSVMLT